LASELISAGIDRKTIVTATEMTVNVPEHIENQNANTVSHGQRPLQSIKRSPFISQRLAAKAFRRPYLLALP
jgi:hypothetical protein